MCDENVDGLYCDADPMLFLSNAYVLCVWARVTKEQQQQQQHPATASSVSHTHKQSGRKHFSCIQRTMLGSLRIGCRTNHLHDCRVNILFAMPTSRWRPRKLPPKDKERFHRWIEFLGYDSLPSTDRQTDKSGAQYGILSSKPQHNNPHTHSP